MSFEGAYLRVSFLLFRKKMPLRDSTNTRTRGPRRDVKDVVGSQAGGAAIQFYCTLVSHGNVRPVRKAWCPKCSPESFCFAAGHRKRKGRTMRVECPDCSPQLFCSRIEHGNNFDEPIYKYKCCKCQDVRKVFKHDTTKIIKSNKERTTRLIEATEKEYEKHYGGKRKKSEEKPVPEPRAEPPKSFQARGTFARIMQNTNNKKTELGCFEVGRMQTGISKEDEDLARAIEASMVEQVPEQSRSLNSFMCPKCPKSGGSEACPKCSPLNFCFLMEHGNSSDDAMSKGMCPKCSSHNFCRDTGHGNSEESPAHKSSCVKCSPEYFGCMEDPKAFRNPGNTKPG